jgi:hypothetical protein
VDMLTVSKFLGGMEGEEYIALNPDSFSENDYWTYRNLQQLCMKLSLGGRGTKEELIMKLTMWHRERERFEDVYPDLYPLKKNNEEEEVEDENENYFPMNVNGNNFSLLRIQINEIQNSSKKKRKRKSSLVFHENQTTTCLVDPTLLRPIKQRLGTGTVADGQERRNPVGAAGEGEQVEEREGMEENERKRNKVLETPTKGILKKQSSVMKRVEEEREGLMGCGVRDLEEDEGEELGQENISFFNTAPLRSLSPSPSLVTPTKPRHSKLQFSPFNGIKIISHRYSSCMPSPSPSFSPSRVALGSSPHPI